MRNLAEISATASLFGCALLYAAQTTAAQAAPVDYAAQDAALARELVEVGVWVSRPLAQCYARELAVDGLQDGSEPARALACDGGALSPTVG